MERRDIQEDHVSDEESEAEQEVQSVERSQEINEPAPETEGTKPVVGFGSGLKRPLELDEEGKPVIKKRKRTKAKSTVIPVPEELEWEGFGTEEDDGLEANLASETESQEVEFSGAESSESERGGSAEGDEYTEAGNWDEPSEENEESSSLDEDAKASRKARTSAFKVWATQQRNDTLGFTPSAVITSNATLKPIDFTPRAPEMDPLPPELESHTATDATRKAFSVHVKRTPEIQEARLALPVVAEEQKIMEAIHNNDVVVIWGSTGSGKTTQVPQFLYEAGYGTPDGPTPGLIGVTQPRRVAAVSMAKRVSDELGDVGSKVSYQVSRALSPIYKFETDVG